jgi:hypothetical protein
MMVFVRSQGGKKQERSIVGMMRSEAHILVMRSCPARREVGAVRVKRRMVIVVHLEKSEEHARTRWKGCLPKPCCSSRGKVVLSDEIAIQM